jgi:hypothetical protein
MMLVSENDVVRSLPFDLSSLFATGFGCRREGGILWAGEVTIVDGEVVPTATAHWDAPAT